MNITELQRRLGVLSVAAVLRAANTPTEKRVSRKTIQRLKSGAIGTVAKAQVVWDATEKLLAAKVTKAKKTKKAAGEHAVAKEDRRVNHEFAAKWSKQTAIADRRERME